MQHRHQRASNNANLHDFEGHDLGKSLCIVAIAFAITSSHEVIDESDWVEAQNLLYWINRVDIVLPKLPLKVPAPHPEFLPPDPQGLFGPTPSYTFC